MIICRIFEKIRQYFGAQSESIPMSFVLGFYVSLVVKRWWEQYKLLPWPDTLALFISAAIPGNVSFIIYILILTDYDMQCNALQYAMYYVISATSDTHLTMILVVAVAASVVSIISNYILRDHFRMKRAD